MVPEQLKQTAMHFAALANATCMYVPACITFGDDSMGTVLFRPGIQQQHMNEQMLVAARYEMPPLAVAIVRMWFTRCAVVSSSLMQDERRLISRLLVDALKQGGMPTALDVKVTGLGVENVGDAPKDMSN